MGSKIIGILFLVLALGAVIYLFRSGLLKGGVSQLTSVFHVSSSSFGIYPQSPSSGGSSGSATSGTSTTTISINPADIPAGFTAAQLSPYFHQVRIGGVSAGGDIYFGYPGQITLNANFGPSQQPIDVTGWQIKSNRGGEYIPQAINQYDPSGLTLPTDIMFASGQVIYLYSFPGPFNLRLNECIGYIAVENKTTPSLPDDCPYVDRSNISTFTGACQNLLNSISGCQVPDLNNLPIPDDDFACRDFIEDNFNYKACYSAHVSDADFLSNQWWIWMGSNPVDSYHDNVYLYDKNGLLVDMYTY